MKVEGTAKIFIRLKFLDGKLNVSGKAIRISVLVSSSIGARAFLSWRDMVVLGVLDPDFPAAKTRTEQVNQSSVEKSSPVEDNPSVGRSLDVYQDGSNPGGGTSR